MYAPNKTPDFRVHREVGLTLRRKLALLVAASVLLVAGVAGATLYFTYQPTTLTVAVGPASGENVRIMQALAQQFARERSSIRLRIVVSEGGPAESAAAITKGTADLAVVRGDLGIPASSQVVAILRHVVVALIVPAPGVRAPKDGKKLKPAKIEKIEQLAGRRVNRLGRRRRNRIPAAFRLEIEGFALEIEVMRGLYDGVGGDGDNCRCAVRQQKHEGKQQEPAGAHVRRNYNAASRATPALESQFQAELDVAGRIGGGDCAKSA